MHEILSLDLEDTSVKHRSVRSDEREWSVCWHFVTCLLYIVVAVVIAVAILNGTVLDNGTH